MCGPSNMLKTLEKEAHVWAASTDMPYDSKLMHWYKSLLSDDERKKYNKLYFSHHRKAYLISHSLLRTSLSRYKKIPPEEWNFSYDAFGRPSIKQPGEISGVQFSLTRTRGMSACLISSSSHVGIDLENLYNLKDPEIMFNHVLVADEIDSLKGLRGKSLRKRFLVYWTLKEAYVKAIGKGLLMPLTQFSFILKSNGRACIRFNHKLTTESSPWQFAYYWLTREILLTVALCNNDASDKIIRRFDVIP